MAVVYSTFFLQTEASTEVSFILPYKTKDTSITLTSLGVVSLSMQKKNRSAEEMKNFI